MKRRGKKKRSVNNDVEQSNLGALGYILQRLSAFKDMYGQEPTVAQFVGADGSQEVTVMSLHSPDSRPPT